MTKVNAALRQVLESRPRRFIVITLTLIVALVASLLAADEYIATRQRCARLSASLVDVKQQAAQLVGLKIRFDEQTKRLNQWRQQTVTEQEIHDFRNKLVDLIRSVGCQQRRLSLEPARYRNWSKGDHPLKATFSRGKNKTTPYRLSSRRVSLAVSGPLESIRELLDELHAKNKLMHTEKLSMRPVRTNSKEIILELEFILFDLQTNTLQETST